VAEVSPPDSPDVGSAPDPATSSGFFVFQPIAAPFCIPIANGRGWCDLNMSDGMLRRLRKPAGAGRSCVILYCGDHDPGGLQISSILRKNLAELLTHAEWLELMPHLIIDRFGLRWQIVPAVLDELLGGGDKERTARVTATFLDMKKLDMAELQKAYKGAEAPAGGER
jgi:hypothetical protein